MSNYGGPNMKRKIKKAAAPANASLNVIAAFGEEQTERLTGVTKSQLRYWDRTDFYRPSYAERNRRVAFSRVYSFNDIVALRVLNVLRNQYGVSLPHLRHVSERLNHLKDERWTGVRLWVLNKRVIWQEPGTGRPQEVLSKQYVVPTIILEDVINETKRDIASCRSPRDPATHGTIRRSRYVNHNAPVIGGTRIPVQAVQRYLEAGYDTTYILKEYPDLTEDDVAAVVHYQKRSAAA